MSQPKARKPRIGRRNLRTTVLYYRDESGAERDVWFMWNSGFLFRRINIDASDRAAGMLPFTTSWYISLN